jgi:glycosyltransferase involved in cell wall biosynthesis
MKRITKTPLRVRAFYPNFFSDVLIAMAALRTVMFIIDDGVEADLMGISSDSSMRRYKRPLLPEDAPIGEQRLVPPIYRDAFEPGIVWAVVRRFFSAERIKALAERRFLSGLRKGDIAYLWPGCSLDLYRKAKARGCTVVSEMINTRLGSSMELLDAEFRALGLTPFREFTREQAEEELESMAQCDFIFSPSPAVTRSILSAGISEAKVLPTSYGLKRAEILDKPTAAIPGRRLTALFAGRICVRKGVHLLLGAWRKAGVDARLVVVGRIAPEMDPFFNSTLRDMPNVEYREFVKDLKPLYRDADFFILPSLEEGSPLVTYLALGAGLPSIVSPMGSGDAVEDGKEGIVVDPHDEEAFAAAIRRMVEDGEMRARMASAARQKATEYTWDVVGRRRLGALRARVGSPDERHLTAG